MKYDFTNTPNFSRFTSRAPHLSKMEWLSESTKKGIRWNAPWNNTTKFLFTGTRVKTDYILATHDNLV